LGNITAKRAQQESKNDVSQEGEKYHFQKGREINIVFRSRYRPMQASLDISSAGTGNLGLLAATHCCERLT
jgi:hypothetical protein